jgi:hypothetical protein
MPRGGDVSPGGRHGHKVRELKRRMDAVLEEERAAREPPPPPVSAEHAAMRERIARGWVEFLGPLDPESPDFRERLGKRIAENPDLANDAVDCLVLMQEEKEFLVDEGVDPRPYDRYGPEF